MLIAALDIGSVATKALLWSPRENRIKAVSQAPSAWQPAAAATEALEKLLETDLNHDGQFALAVTGYGRNLVGNENNDQQQLWPAGAAPMSFNEITALARGVNRVAPEVRLVLDVGGQDSKGLSIDEQGRILDFVLNDKCAAGAGAFIDSICQSFNLDHAAFAALAASGRPVPLSSMCTVFAQTELVAQIAKGVSRADLAAGILVSLATRLKTQCGRLFTKAPVALTGGLSRMKVFADILSESLEAPVVTPPQAPFLAALGAALMAEDRLIKPHEAAHRK